MSTTERLMELSMATDPLDLSTGRSVVGNSFRSLWGAVSGAKRVEKVVGKDRVQGL